MAKVLMSCVLALTVGGGVAYFVWEAFRGVSSAIVRATGGA